MAMLLLPVTWQRASMKLEIMKNCPLGDTTNIQVCTLQYTLTFWHQNFTFKF